MRRNRLGAEVKLPNVQRRMVNGRPYKYHRFTRARLPDDVPEEHPRFAAAWAAEEAKSQDRKPPEPVRAKEGTIEAGCIAFLASQSFASLSLGYRPVIRGHVEAIRRIGGKGKMANLKSRDIAANLEPLTPAVARNRLKAWRKLALYWSSMGWINEDVSAGVKRKKMPKTDGFKAWTKEDVAAFRAHWPVGTPQRLAMELLAWTGARVSDAVRIGPGMVRDGVLEFRQAKTGVTALVPWPGPDLAPCLSGGNMVYMVTAYGKPRTVKGASQWFSGSATQAGLKGLSAHGLRKYRMNTLAEEGASVLKMQAWVGHTTLDEVEHYTRQASRRAAILGVEQERNAVQNSSRSVQK